MGEAVINTYTGATKALAQGGFFGIRAGRRPTPVGANASFSPLRNTERSRGICRAVGTCVIKIVFQRAAQFSLDTVQFHQHALSGAQPIAGILSRIDLPQTFTGVAILVVCEKVCGQKTDAKN